MNTVTEVISTWAENRSKLLNWVKAKISADGYSGLNYLLPGRLNCPGGV